MYNLCCRINDSVRFCTVYIILFIYYFQKVLEKYFNIWDKKKKTKIINEINWFLFRIFFFEISQTCLGHFPEFFCNLEDLKKKLKFMLSGFFTRVNNIKSWIICFYPYTVSHARFSEAEFDIIPYYVTVIKQRMGMVLELFPLLRL